ncbi:MAG: hypothetical protein DLM59_00990 [Pseudonocardiales bacterium]|nr:MAG: hypothetical protein DLM59_00990 [Pseudonocardiales bacterium]
MSGSSSVRGSIARSVRSLGREFGLLWTGQSVSNVGDRVTLFVVPTLMIFVLKSSPFEIGLVSMAQYLAIPILSLLAGVLVDRWDLRRLLIACDLIRLVVIAAIPVAYWYGYLSVPLLFVCVVLVSAATVFFNIAYLPAMVAIVEPADLVRANSRLETSRTVAEVGGPSVAAGLYQLFGVAALLVDAATYLFSAACFRVMQPCGGRTSRDERVWSRLKLGIRQNWDDPVLRRATAGTLGANIGGPIFVTLLPVLAYRGLHLSVGVFGVVMSAAAAGGVVGALVAPKVSRRMGAGRMQAWSIFLHSACGLGILAAPAFPPAIVLAITLAFYGAFMTWYNVCSQSVRQVRMAVKDQAVIYAAYRTVTWGVIPISAFVGGWAVTLLTPHFAVLDAAKIVMVGGTVIGMFAYLPLSGLQRLLDGAALDQAAVGELPDPPIEPVVAFSPPVDAPPTAELPTSSTR